MKYVKYSKYVADPFDDLSAEDLLQMLGDFLLDSGFYNQYQNIYDMDPERNDGAAPPGASGGPARSGKDS